MVALEAGPWLESSRLCVDDIASPGVGAANPAIGRSNSYQLCCSGSLGSVGVLGALRGGRGGRGCGTGRSCVCSGACGWVDRPGGGHAEPCAAEVQGCEASCEDDGPNSIITRVEKKEGRCRVGGARSMRHQASGSHASMLPLWLGTRDLTRCFGVRPRQRDVQSSPGRYHKIYGLFVRSEKIQKKSISEKTTAQSRWLRGSQCIE